jgi:hypothetical protein
MEMLRVGGYKRSNSHDEMMLGHFRCLVCVCLACIIVAACVVQQCKRIDKGKTKLSLLPKSRTSIPRRLVQSTIALYIHGLNRCRGLKVLNAGRINTIYYQDFLRNWSSAEDGTYSGS